MGWPRIYIFSEIKTIFGCDSRVYITDETKVTGSFMLWIEMLQWKHILESASDVIQLRIVHLAFNLTSNFGLTTYFLNKMLTL